MRLLRPILRSLALTVLLLPAPSFAADPFTDAARQLTVQIAARAGAGSEISITTRNLSSLSESQFAEVRRALEAQLRAQGLRVVPAAQAVADVRITLSENVQGYLWIAEIRQGQTQQAAIVPIPRAPAAAAPASAALFTLRKTALWVQDEPILDVAVLEGGGAATNLLVLDPARVALYAVQGGRGELQQSQPITRSAPWPRDVRGRLVLGRDHLFDAYLPGMHCSTSGQNLAPMSCAATDDPWPLDASLNAFFAPTRNFFTGILSGGAARGKSTAPFFSAAKVSENGGDLWILAGVDGRVRLFNGVNETFADFKGWGSDITGISSGCGSGSQVLVTRAADGYTPDSIQAYELVTRQAVPVSQPLEFAGPITALWPAAGGGAIAVSRNLKTGRYEAFGLTITCER
jgi:hypothetical protein